MVNLLSVIEKYWMMEGRRERKTHYPSDALACRRQLFYKWAGYGETEPMDSTGHWRVNIGNAIHTLIQVTLKEIADNPEVAAKVAWPGFQVMSELRSGPLNVSGEDWAGGIQLKNPVSFRIDLSFLDDELKAAGGEIKSKFGFGVQAIRESSIEPRMLAQGAMYLVFGWVMTEREKADYAAQREADPSLPEQTFDPIRRYHYPIVSRDNGDRVEFVLEMVGNPPDAKFIVYRVLPDGSQTQVVKRYGYALFTRILERLQYVEEFLEVGEVPPRDYRVAIKNGEIRKDFQHQGKKYKSDWQCFYCPFMTRCWSEVRQLYLDGHNAEDFDRPDTMVGDDAQNRSITSTETVEAPQKPEQKKIDQPEKRILLTDDREGEIL